MKRFGCRMILAGLMAAAAAQRAAAALDDDGRALEASPDATVITADKLTFDYLQKFALFENNVLVNDPRLQLSANRLTVIFTEDGGAQTIKAEGKVLLTQGDKKARADVATYDVASGRIVLAGGPPQVMQGRNILEGEVITFWRDQQRVECKPRARLVVYSEDFGSDADALFRPAGAE
ncbi:MAG TPA: LptA/OstA family protein [Kiritimatiellia bacterium]|nr:LptA/OstA family protein [Kiritimatiellia bacterium]HPJ56015.1 LptA/OstA family protein [Kiritimatiellia bacterium]HRX05582.1 LptA/OstA family protein [Kiritimatiellia bacterium]